MLQPSSIDVRLDRYFRLFDNHKYPFIDPAADQPDLTRLVEVDAGGVVRAAPRRVRPRVHVRGRDAARRHRRAARGQVVAGAARAAHALDGRVHRPRLLRARDARAVQRRDAADPAVARHEDRPDVLLPAVVGVRAPLRVLASTARGTRGSAARPRRGPSRTSTGRTSEAWRGSPASRPTTPVRSRHLLALPADVGADEVEVLAISRFAAGAVGGGRGLPQPRGIMGPMTAALGIRAVGSRASRPARCGSPGCPRSPVRTASRPRTPSASGCRRRSTLAYVLVAPASAARSRTRAVTATASSARSPTACRSARRSASCSGWSPPRAGSAAPCAPARTASCSRPTSTAPSTSPCYSDSLARTGRGARRGPVGAAARAAQRGHQHVGRTRARRRPRRRRSPRLGGRGRRSRAVRRARAATGSTTRPSGSGSWTRRRPTTS